MRWCQHQVRWSQHLLQWFKQQVKLSQQVLWILLHQVHPPRPPRRFWQADEDRASLTTELSALKEKFAALSEEREHLAASLAGSLPPPPSGAAAVGAAQPPARAEGGAGLGGLMGGKLRMGNVKPPTLDFRLPGRKAAS